MREDSHRARQDRLREHDRKMRRRRHRAAWIAGVTSLITMGLALAARRALGRNVALGLAVTAGIFALACGIVASRVAREKGRDSVAYLTWMGLATGFAMATSVGTDPDDGWDGVGFAVLFAWPRSYRGSPTTRFPRS